MRVGSHSPNRLQCMHVCPGSGASCVRGKSRYPTQQILALGPHVCVGQPSGTAHDAVDRKKKGKKRSHAAAVTCSLQQAVVRKCAAFAALGARGLTGRNADFQPQRRHGRRCQVVSEPGPFDVSGVVWTLFRHSWTTISRSHNVYAEGMSGVRTTVDSFAYSCLLVLQCTCVAPQPQCQAFFW